jgi:hypothetical protein
MSLWKPTHSQYADQRIVASFGEFMQYYNERGFTHISSTISNLAIVEGVGYEVHRYITTCELPYKEWSEKRPWTDREEW